VCPWNCSSALSESETTIGGDPGHAVVAGAATRPSAGSAHPPLCQVAPSVRTSSQGVSSEGSQPNPEVFAVFSMTCTRLIININKIDDY
jgi:hypothetical protein